MPFTQKPFADSSVPESGLGLGGKRLASFVMKHCHLQRGRNTAAVCSHSPRQSLPASEPSGEPQIIKKLLTRSHQHDKVLSVVLIMNLTEEGGNHYPMISSTYCPFKMLKTFFTNYITVGLSVQGLFSAILQQWTVDRQSQTLAFSLPKS